MRHSQHAAAMLAYGKASKRLVSGYAAALADVSPAHAEQLQECTEMHAQVIDELCRRWLAQPTGESVGDGDV